jgi:hypothetical protein
MKILSILNEMSKSKVNIFNNVYEININIFFKNLNNIKLGIPLNSITSNFDNKINNINFI